MSYLKVLFTVKDELLLLSKNDIHKILNLSCKPNSTKQQFYVVALHSKQIRVMFKHICKLAVDILVIFLIHSSITAGFCIEILKIFLFKLVCYIYKFAYCSNHNFGFRHFCYFLGIKVIFFVHLTFIEFQPSI